MTVASIDVAWYRSVNEFARDTSWAHGAVANYANWAGLVLLAMLLIAGWLSGRRRDDAPLVTATAFLVGVGAVLALLANQVIGPVFSRPRPCHSLGHVEVLLHCASDSSFPSDHAMIAGAFAAGLLLLSTANLACSPSCLRCFSPSHGSMSGCTTRQTSQAASRLEL